MVEQPAFVLDLTHNRFIPPETSILSLPEIEFFLKFVNGRRPLLQNEPDKSTRILLTDLRSNQAMIKEDDIWQEQVEFTNIRLKPRSLSTILIVSGPLDPEALPVFEERLKKAADCLPRHNGSIFILEKKEEDVDPKLRRRILHEIGFVQNKLLKPKNQPYLIWEGSKPKEHHALDLTKYPDFWETLELTIKNYQTVGFEPVIVDPVSASLFKLTDIIKKVQADLEQEKNTDFPLPEIIHRCLSSKNPPTDVVNLINGLGLTVLDSNCGGCLWQIDTLGTETKIGQCDDPDCNHKRPAYGFRQNYQYKIGQTKLEAVCFDCGGFFQKDGADYIDGPNLIVNTRVLRQTLFRSEILVSVGCPRCDYGYQKKLWALNAQIEF